MKKPEQPTQEEIEKVGRWWQWVKVTSCPHSNGITYSSTDSEMTCADCGEPMFMLSEAQIEEMKEKRDG